MVLVLVVDLDCHRRIGGGWSPSVQPIDLSGVVYLWECIGRHGCCLQELVGHPLFSTGT